MKGECLELVANYCRSAPAPFTGPELPFCPCSSSRLRVSSLKPRGWSSLHCKVFFFLLKAPSLNHFSLCLRGLDDLIWSPGLFALQWLSNVYAIWWALLLTHRYQSASQAANDKSGPVACSSKSVPAIGWQYRSSHWVLSLSAQCHSTRKYTWFYFKL